MSSKSCQTCCLTAQSHYLKQTKTKPETVKYEHEWCWITLIHNLRSTKYQPIFARCHLIDRISSCNICIMYEIICFSIKWYTINKCSSQCPWWYITNGSGDGLGPFRNRPSPESWDCCLRSVIPFGVTGHNELTHSGLNYLVSSFKMLFSEWKSLYFDSNFTEVCSYR